MRTSAVNQPTPACTHIQQAARPALRHVEDDGDEVDGEAVAAQSRTGGGGWGWGSGWQQAQPGPTAPRHSPQHRLDEAAHGLHVQPHGNGLAVPAAVKTRMEEGVTQDPTPIPSHPPTHLRPACSLRCASVAAVSVSRRPSASCAAAEAPGEYASSRTTNLWHNE